MPFVAVIIAIVAVVGGAIFFFRNEANAPVVEVTPVTEVATTTPPLAIPVTETPAPVVATGSAPVATNTTATTPPKTTPTPPVTTPKPPTPAPTPAPAPVITPPAPTPAPVPVVTAPTPKTLTSKINYRTPSGSDTSVTVTMTLEGTTVTAVSNTYTGNSTDQGYQNRFDGAYKTQVIGKNLGDISLARVGGASLTSKAFNEATKAIIAQS